VDAESRVRHFGRATGAQTRVLRIPGIYAPDREGGTPLARLQKGTPVLVSEEDVYTNHIHADDLARACVLALWRGRAQGVYNVNDDAVMKMGDYMDAAAALYGLPPAPRLARAALEQVLSPMQMSFLGESRRMDNRRIKRELRLVLRYPSVLDGLALGLPQRST
jgi:nucleoside-diphosphate-sugar epimerase